MDSRTKFEEFWKSKGQTSGFLFDFCFECWKAGRESMREEAAHMAEKYFHSTTAKQIRKIEP